MRAFPSLRPLRRDHPTWGLAPRRSERRKPETKSVALAAVKTPEMERRKGGRILNRCASVPFTGHGVTKTLRFVALRRPSTVPQGQRRGR